MTDVHGRVQVIGNVEGVMLDIPMAFHWIPEVGGFCMTKTVEVTSRFVDQSVVIVTDYSGRRLIETPVRAALPGTRIVWTPFRTRD